MATRTERLPQATGILFRAGMKVRGWDDGDRHKGRPGSVTPYEGVLIDITDFGSPNDKGMIAKIRVSKSPRGNVEAGYDYSIWFDTMELLTLPLDLSKPVTHRSGKSVEVVPTGESDRPHSTYVNGLVLTFDKYGLFYPGIEQPIDLVNT